jgi:hypothetical protein
MTSAAKVLNAELSAASNPRTKNPPTISSRSARYVPHYHRSLMDGMRLHSPERCR